MTRELFRDDSYLKSCKGEIVEINERGGIILDQTVFYATSGGQPGDKGSLTLEDGSKIEIVTSVFDENKNIVHVSPKLPDSLKVGAKVDAEIDWEHRYKLMRVHSALHILSSVLPYPVTGGNMSGESGRLDFDIEESGLDKQEITARINDFISKDLKVNTQLVSTDELKANPELVKTMSVKPPMDGGMVRLVEIDNCDLQACGGTHVKTTAEISKVEIYKIENKGAKNRRVRLRLV